MRKQITFVLSFLMVWVGIIPSHMGSIKRFDRGEVIVKYLGKDLPQISQNEIALKKVYHFENTKEGEYILAHFTSNKLNTSALIQAFQDIPGIIYAEPNTTCHVCELPNDPYVSNQWYLNNEEINYERSSKVDLGIETMWEKVNNSSNNLEGNVVAVIDTGVDYNHADLAPNIWENTTTLPGKHGYNFKDQNEDPMDEVGHGTHCAGIIAAETNNGIGIAGVSPNTKIMAIKYMDEAGNGTLSNAIAAYEYILEAKNQGVNVVAISNSWEVAENPKALEDVIISAGEKGIISVCAAGNTAMDLDSQKTFPACYHSPYTIVVAATTPDNTLASFSCYGKYTVDVAAPGTCMLSTYNQEGYIPTLATDNKTFLSFEDENIGFEGKNISITDEVAFEGTHSLLWQLIPEEDTYLEGDLVKEYVNAIELTMPEAEEGLYLGVNFWTQGIKDENGSEPVCYIEAFRNNLWEKIGQLDMREINFWESTYFPLKAGTTQIRLIGIGVTQESKVYLDAIGIGKTTGKYAYLQGTSAAAPIVAGEVAMMSRLFPKESISKVRNRIVGGVDHAIVGLVASDGVINMNRAVQNPYAVMNKLVQGDNGNIKIIGSFFGINPGSLALNGETLEVTAWTDAEIIAKYVGDFEGYGKFTLTRSDGEVSEQNLLISNKVFKWTNHAPLPVAIKNAATAAYGDTIYVIGGTTADEEVSQAVFGYNVTTDTWKPLANLPDQANLQSYAKGMSAAALKDKVLLMNFDEDQEVNTYYIYNIKEDNWEIQNYEVVPEPREYAELVAYKEAVYMIGGRPRGDYTGQEALSQDIWRLNKNKAWEKVASLSEGRYAPIMAVVENRLVITGGFIENGNNVASTEIYDGKQMEMGVSLPFAGLNSQNTVFGGGKKLYVMTDGISFESPSLTYTPATSVWENSPYHLGYKEMNGVGSAVAYNELYAIGGTADYRVINQVESIKIEGDVVQEKDYDRLIIEGAIIGAIVLLIILILLWLRKKRKPKKMYIR